jgi:hypothetical protein
LKLQRHLPLGLVFGRQKISTPWINEKHGTLVSAEIADQLGTDVGQILSTLSLGT